MICGRALAIVLLSLSIFAANPAEARRVALVIGNDSYTELPALQKAVADATDFAAVLTEKGFDKVILRQDLTLLQMDLALAEFLDTIAAGDTAVFFYSGHGWSDGEQNFLVGTDVPKVAAERALERISLPLQNGVNGVLDEMARRGAALKVAIVDACRDNPFMAGAAGRGVGLVAG